jgi:hypothetical protein
VAVGLGVGGVGELVGQEDVVAVGHRAGGVNGLVHPAHRLGHLDACPIEPQQRLTLAAHALREREDELVALGRAHERQGDPGVAARCLNNRRAARLDPPLALGGLDHRHADPVLHAATRIEHLKLGEQLDVKALGHARQRHHRRAADQARDVCRNAGRDG